MAFLTRRQVLLGMSLWPWVASAEVEFLPVHRQPRDFDALRQRMLEEAGLELGSEQELLRSLRARWGGPLQDRSESQWLAADGVPIWVEVPNSAPRGILLHFHAGGWCCGHAHSEPQRFRALAEQCQLVVVSVDYRLAPENPFPAATQDAFKVAHWLFGQAVRRWGTSNLILHGYEAGAYLAASLLLTLGSLASRFLGVILHSGIYDLGLTPAARLSLDHQHPDLSLLRLRRFVEWLTPGQLPEQRRESNISPLYRNLPTNSPPCLILTGGADILLQDSLSLAQRWGQSTKVQVALFPGAPHDFDRAEFPESGSDGTFMTDFVDSLL